MLSLKKLSKMQHAYFCDCPLTIQHIFLVTRHVSHVNVSLYNFKVLKTIAMLKVSCFTEMIIHGSVWFSTGCDIPPLRRELLADNSQSKLLSKVLFIKQCK